MKAVTPTRELEEGLWARGHELVAGVDEVGRGPLAGPVVVAAVVVPRDANWEGVRDSKRLSPKRREELSAMIKQEAIAVGIGWAGRAYIDEFGLTAAMKSAGEQALLQVPPVGAIILDGKHNYLGDHWPVMTEVKADLKSVAVAAASIVAKVARDTYMEMLDELHPGYGFAAHKGYGSAAHMEALMRLGPCSQHRVSWQPVKNCVNG